MRLDLLYVGKWLKIRTTMPPEVPWLQDLQTRKTADEMQYVWRKVNSPTFAIPSKIKICLFSEGVYAFDNWGKTCNKVLGQFFCGKRLNVQTKLKELKSNWKLVK